MAQPAPVNDTYNVDEDAILKIGSPVFGVLGNDSDPDGDSLAAFVSDFPANPLFNFKTNGTFRYDARYHGQLFVVDATGALTDSGGAGITELVNGFDSLAAGFTVTDTFTYTATDGVESDQATVTITITGVNDDPVGVNDFATLTQGTMTTIDSTANDTDVDIWPTPDVLSITGFTDIDDETGDGIPGGGSGASITTDAGGTVSIVGGQIQYIAAADFFGIDSFSYTVDDGKGGSSTAVVRVTVLPDNQAPDAVDDTRMVDENDGATALASVLGNDTDADDAPLIGAQLVGTLLTALTRVDEFGAPIAGDTGILVDFNSDGTFTYDPNGAFDDLAVGEKAYVQFQYEAFDGKGAMDTATVTIEINGVNNPPDANTPADGIVYEAGLAAGSGDGSTTIFYDFDFVITDSDSTPFVSFSSDGADLSPSADQYGTWTIVDGDTVRYTLTSNAPHSDVQGHNGGVFESIDVYIVDGTDYIMRSVSVEIIDDVNFLVQLPNGAGTGNDLDDTTAMFTNGGTSTDTFTLIPGADGQTLEVVGVPATFTLGDGRTVTSTVGTYQGNLAVIGTDSEGDPFYRLVFDPDPDGDPTTLLGSYTFTVLQDPPTIINDLDFSALRAGGPQEYPYVENIGFNGGFFTSATNIRGTFSEGTGSSDDINPNNAGGIGIGNGNIERMEALAIDLTLSSGTVSGIEFDIEGVGGGIGSGDVLWEAYLSGVLIDSGAISVNLTSTTGAHTLSIDPAGQFDFLYVALDPSDFDSNDKARINRIATVEEQLADDYLLGFRVASGDGDGDLSPAPTATPDYFDFYVTLDGASTTLIDPGIDVF